MKNFGCKWPLVAAVVCGACDAEEAAGPFLETRYVRYETDMPFTPCGGLASATDRKVEGLYALLAEPHPAGQCPAIC